MNQNFSIVNLAHENKFIYIHSYLHSLKGVAIAPVPYEHSTKFSPHEKGNHYFRTFPIVGDDWQVIDDEWENMDLDYGFDFAILDGKEKVIPLANRAFIGALNEGSDDITRTCIALLREAKQKGIYISQDKLIDRTKDTLYIRDVSVEYRYKLLRDTVRIVERDSIPYEVTIVETKEITRPLTLFDKICRWSFTFLLILVLLYIRRIVKKFHKPQTKFHKPSYR